ncbi:ketopantoate reductase family protein [Pigmentiphaga litoralis]|uniref:2-dehydropantoate 2-reductase n=1 Tax=Pigmentiphaga litoralis TaxID=516702 RepID=A0A7Y9IYG0_9BURK|nr:2-dehydropantoate 2-reductase [Pigmentiphaga litoralis]NYE26310.1 2-dehydropantoate 2-reductase [Pigmentiphaga litoralis]NYE85430.1 2-dehydropantoate 2-reductase [Pigmentiphaga litoralis]
MQTVTVFGAGAVGGNVAVKLATSGVAKVSVVARGEHLKAIQTRGLTLVRDGTRTTAHVEHATDDASELPPQDLVIVTLKATALSGAAEALARLRAPGAPVLFLTNGIPWWWAHGLPAAHPSSGASLDLLDPSRTLRDRLGAESVLGGVIYSPNEVIEPGVIVNRARNHYVLGEPDGSLSARLEAVRALFAAAGIEVATHTELRREIFGKLILNASGNPVAALTRLTTRERLEDTDLRDLSARIIDEVMAVGVALDCPLDPDVDIDEQLDPARVKGLRPSMLQDALAGRTMEVDAMLGQIQVFARHAGLPTPTLDVVLALVRGLNQHLAQSRT